MRFLLFLSGSEKVGQTLRKDLSTYGLGFMQAQCRGDSNLWMWDCLLTEILRIRSGMSPVRAATYNLFRSVTSFSKSYFIRYLASRINPFLT